MLNITNYNFSNKCYFEISINEVWKKYMTVSSTTNLNIDKKCFLSIKSEY